MKTLTDRQWVLLSDWIKNAEVPEWYVEDQSQKEFNDTRNALYRLHQIAKKRSKVFEKNNR